MKAPFSARPLILALAATAGLAFAAPAAAFDEEAAKLLFKQNECGKCHNPEKAKKGPALKKIAATYKEKKKTVADMTTHMSKGAKIKIKDDNGTEIEEDHKVIDTKDQKAKENLAQWILSH